MKYFQLEIKGQGLTVIILDDSVKNLIMILVIKTIALDDSSSQNLIKIPIVDCVMKIGVVTFKCG